MGADIWLGRPGESLARFRDNYTGAISLNAVGLFYWVDLWPKLINGETWPLELNDWLAETLREGVRTHLDGPNALQLARAYLDEAQMPNADPVRMIDHWREHVGELIGMVERSSALQLPLTMSL